MRTPKKIVIYSSITVEFSIFMSATTLISLEEFKKYLYVKRGLDKADYYHTSYKRFSEFLGSRDLTENICLDFFTDLKSSGLSKSTYNNYLKAIKHLVRAHGHTYLDSYKGLKTEKPYIPILEENEMIRLIEVAYEFEERRAVAIELFLRTGLRCSELINLTWENVKDDCLFIKDTKTNHSREVYLVPDLIEKIDSLKGHHPIYVFATGKGKLEAQRFNQFLEKCVRKAGITKHITAHKLRHSYATLASEKDMNVFTIKDAMGHTNIQTTQTYVHTSRTKLKEVAKAVSLGNYKPTVEEVQVKIDDFLNELRRAGYRVGTTIGKNETVITIPRV